MMATMRAISLLLCLAVAYGAPDVKVEQKASSSASQSNSKTTSSSAKVVAQTKPPAPVTIAKPSVNYISSPQAVTHVIDVPHSSYVLQQVQYVNSRHLDVYRLSNGFQAVALDDSYGHVVDYIYLGSEINLIPSSGSYLLPAKDILDGHTSYVNLGTSTGHLVLSQAVIGNSVYQGFNGYDEIGPVFVPVSTRHGRFSVKPILYRTDRLQIYTTTKTSIKHTSYPVIPTYTTIPSSIVTPQHIIAY